MNITIASPTGGNSYDNVSYVSLWCVEGQIGVLKNHADMIAALRAGKIRIDRDGGAVQGVLGSGFVRIEKGDIHIAAEQWTAEPGAIAIDARLAEIDAKLSADIGAATKDKLSRERQFLLACRA